MGGRTGLRPVIMFVSVLTVLSAVAGCSGGEPLGRTTVSPTASSQARPTATATPTVSAEPAIGGDGITELGPTEIVERAKQATLSAPSVRVLDREGEGGRVLSDVRFEGPRGAGRLNPAGGPGVDVVLDGEAFYLKADRSYWLTVGGEQAARLLTGKYLRTTVRDPDYQPFVMFCSLRMTLQLHVHQTNFANAKLGTPTTLHGVPAVPLESLGEVLYVATEGPPYILKYELTFGKDPVEFLDYGKPVDIRPPTQTVDVSKLKAIPTGPSR